MEKIRELIVQAARTAFAERGYSRASMRYIAATAGISAGGIYLYFRSKRRERREN